MQRVAPPPPALGRAVAPARPVVAVRGPNAVRAATGLVGLGVGAGALVVAEGPGRATTYAGSSAVGAALTVCAGVALIAAGLAMCLVRRPGRTGDLALLAGACWFAPVWIAWQDGPALIPSVAMVAAGFTFPLLVHLVLTYPAGKTNSKPASALTAVVYAEALLAALALALFRDPYFDPSCLANCTVNVFLLRSLPSLTRALQVADRWFTASAALVVVTICARRLLRASVPARQRLLPVYLPAVGFAAAVLARAVALQKTKVEDPFNTALFVIFAGGCAAVIMLAAGLTWAALRAQAERRAVARIAASLDEVPAPGSLQTSLAKALRDPGLQIAYWLPHRACYADAGGHVVPEPAATPGRAVTRVTRNGRTVAVISHSGAVPAIETQMGPATRLGLENERLQAELLGQLEELRASRARIVETADTERRRLERDFHDGAQQHLLALFYDIRLARTAAQADGNDAAEMALADAAGRAQDVLRELRELAHGIYPAVLAEAGIGPALASLADTAPLPVQIRAAQVPRYPAPVEAAAYFAVAEALGDATRRGAGHAAVTVIHDDEQLAITVEDNGSGGVSHMAASADRVGAVGGTLSVAPGRCLIEVPCV